MFFFSFFLLDIPNLLIIEKANDSDYLMKTSRFAGLHNNRDAIVLNTFDATNGFSKSTDLFPDKFTDLQEREVRLAFCNYQPYSVWSEVVRHF